MPKKNVGPKISETSIDFMRSNFKNTNGGCTYVLDSFPSLYNITLRSELKNKFSPSELALMVDALSTLALNPGIAGRHLLLEVEDAIMLEKMGEKWGIGNILDFLARVRGLTVFQAHCLEIWCRAFRSQNMVGIEEFVEELAGAPLKIGTEAA